MGCLQLLGAKLLPVLAIDGPAAGGLDVLAGRDGRGFADDGSEVLASLELHPQHGEAALDVVERHALDDAGQRFRVGVVSRRAHMALSSGERGTSLATGHGPQPTQHPFARTPAAGRTAGRAAIDHRLRPRRVRQSLADAALPASVAKSCRSSASPAARALNPSHVTTHKMQMSGDPKVTPYWAR